MMPIEQEKTARWRGLWRRSVRARIFAFILALLILYLALTAATFSQTLERTTYDQLSQGTKQSVDILISSIHSELEITNSISYSLLQNTDVTRWLQESDGTSDMYLYRAVNSLLMRTYTTFSGIESVYLFRNDGQSINARQHLPNLLFLDYRKTSWYEKAVALRGGYFMTLNADGTLFSTAGQNNISFIRQLYYLDSFQPSGVLMINRNESFITKITKSIYEKYGTEFFLLDEKGESLIRGQALPQHLMDIQDEGIAQSADNQSFFVYRTTVPQLNWTVISAMPYDGNHGFSPYPGMLLIPVGAAVVMNLLIMLFITGQITRPLKGMMVSMHGVREGRFEPLPMDGRQDEIGQLKDTYNVMVGELNTMISQRVEMEREKRRYELDILGEQVKPHFLYNTLDTISYLILSKDYQNALDAVNALSRYYSISLNKGAETVSLMEEVRMIQSYLSLQKMRYGEMITDEYDIEESAKAVPILRNTLQPLVENCIYHGIKPSGEPGVISISAKLKEDMLIVTVEDDGLGMTPEQLKTLDKDIIDQNLHSFGVRGTIKRARLFYNRQDLYEIHSRPGEGTRVQFKFPIMQGGDANAGQPH